MLIKISLIFTTGFAIAKTPPYYSNNFRTPFYGEIYDKMLNFSTVKAGKKFAAIREVLNLICTHFDQNLFISILRSP